MPPLPACRPVQRGAPRSGCRSSPPRPPGSPCRRAAPARRSAAAAGPPWRRGDYPFPLPRPPHRRRRRRPGAAGSPRRGPAPPARPPSHRTAAASSPAPPAVPRHRAMLPSCKRGTGADSAELRTWMDARPSTFSASSGPLSADECSCAAATHGIRVRTHERFGTAHHTRCISKYVS